MNTIIAAEHRQAVLSDKVECQACPILCQISPGRTGACDRYRNDEGSLSRVDPLIFIDSGRSSDGAVLPMAGDPSDTSSIADPTDLRITGIGASTTYPEYKPVPFVVGSISNGVNVVTAVTEGIFSYCSMKVKIDTDRFLGAEQSSLRYKGEVVGHVTTAEYGSQMLSIGGVHALTAGSKKQGRLACESMLLLGNKLAVDLEVDGGAKLTIQADRAPIVDGEHEKSMRAGCGSAVIGMFAKQLGSLADEVVVIDDHITGVLTQHQAGRGLGMAESGIGLHGKRSTPGRYFQVSTPGSGWGGTMLTRPLDCIEGWDAAVAKAGLRLLVTSTTGEHAQWFVLDETLVPVPTEMPAAVRAVVERIRQNCEPARCSVMFLGGAGGSLRAAIAQNPIELTTAIADGRVKVTCGGAPVFLWPGGGITFMVDVAKMPDNSFGSVPTPAIVAPLEFTMSRQLFAELGADVESIRTIEDIVATGSWHRSGSPRTYRLVAPTV